MNWFVERIKSFGDRTAIYYRNETFSYNELYSMVAGYTNLLSEKIPPGIITALLSDYNPNSIALFLALIINKNIIVPVFTSNNEEIKERIKESYADDIIKVTDFDLEITHINNNSERHPLINHLQEKYSSGLILFSSGSTGKPKAMLHNLDNLLLSYKRDYVKDINTLIFLTIDHIGGIDTLFRQLSIGGIITIPELRTPEYICKLIERFRVNVLPVSPTFLNLLLISESYKSYDLTSLKIIGYGAEPASDFLLEKLHEAFPDVEIQQKFGTSETNAIKIKSMTSGSPYMKFTDSNIEYKIVENELWIKSRTQILGYLNRDMSSFTDDGWFKTGDIVEILDNGYFKITGRINEVINVGGQKVIPSEVEDVIMQMAEIADCMIYGVKNLITGQIVTADIVLHSSADIKEIKKKIRKYCSDKLEQYKIPAKINIVDKTNYGERFKKIRRK